MKWPAASLFFSGLLAIAAAATIDVNTIHHAEECVILQLYVVAPPASRLNGPVYIISDSLIGVPGPSVQHPQRARPAFFYPMPSTCAACTAATANTSGIAVMLHQWSDSIFDLANDHLLAVPTGGGALAPLAIAVVPANATNATTATNATAGTGLDWQSFVLSDGLVGRNGPARPATEADHGRAARSLPAPAAPPPLRLNSLTYAGQPHGRWVAIQRTQDVFAVAWYDGVSPIIDTYQPIDIVYQELRCK